MTAKAVYAHICAPHYAASAMDGVAVSAKETFGATETTPVTLKPDQFLVLDTGDPIPEDKDAVIMVEDIVKNGDGSITIHAAAAPWQHIQLCIRDRPGCPQNYQCAEAWYWKCIT